MIWLDKYMFMQLHDIMVQRNLLADNREVKVKEQLGIFLFIMARGASYRDTRDRFRRSISTINQYFHEVLRALKLLSFDIIRPHQDLTRTPQKIAENPRYWPYFEDCVGAIDGTLIKAVVSDDEGQQYRSRKGEKCWNCFAVCSFDMLFTYLHVGWEGSVHDLTVWNDSLTLSQFCFPHPPPGKYYLVDSGYPNTIGYLAPYKDKSVRYHIPEFRRGTEASGLKEIFNHRHSSLRTTIERGFGILKSTWKILKNMPQVDEKFQLDIITGSFTLHNFIRMHRLGIPIGRHDYVEGDVDFDMFNTIRKAHMDSVRDQIAVDIVSADSFEQENVQDDDEEDAWYDWSDEDESAED